MRFLSYQLKFIKERNEIMAKEMKPLYIVEDSEITIRRGPADILWFGGVVFIIAVLLELCLVVSMTGEARVGVVQVIGVLLIPVISILEYRFMAKRYANTWVKITKDKVVFHTAGRIKEIELHNLEKVTLDGKTAGITTDDLVMKFVMKDGSKFSYSCLGNNTYLFLNALSMKGISIFEKNAPYEIQLVLMDILDEDGLEKLLEETEVYLKELVEGNPDLGMRYQVQRFDKLNEVWGSIVTSDNKGFSTLVAAKRFGQVFSYNFIEYCENYMRRIHD